MFSLRNSFSVSKKVFYNLNNGKLKKANLKIGEDEKLEADRKIILNSERINESLNPNASWFDIIFYEDKNDVVDITLNNGEVEIPEVLTNLVYNASDIDTHNWLDGSSFGSA